METKTAFFLPITLAIQSEYDISHVRKRVRDYAQHAHFNLIKTTKIITAASELARNTFKYAGTGTVQIELIEESKSIGLQLVFQDEGPGIADIEKAMTDGFSSGKSLGLGLSGSKRLVDEFAITSSIGNGTCVKIILWK